MTDPFALFGVSPSYELNLDALAARHKELSLSAHPDRLRAERAERRASLARSIDLNQAFRILKDPITRAEALLKYLGHEELLEVKVDQSFLFEILELREELSLSAEKKDRVNIEKLLTAVSKKRSEVDALVASGFSALGSKVETPLLDNLGRELSRLRYLKRFEDEAKSTLDEL